VANENKDKPAAPALLDTTAKTPTDTMVDKAAKDQADGSDSLTGVDADSTAAEKVNAEYQPNVPTAYEEGLKAGYMGTAMSNVPNAVHEAGNEALRAEIYGAAPVPETRDGLDGPFASMEAAKAAVRFSNDLATVPNHPTLRGAAVNTAGDSELSKDRK
jgi:hypothetical protein